MDGATDSCSSFHFKDSSFVTLMNSRLSDEECKNMMHVQEDASYRARYHPAKLSADALRTFSFNTGKREDVGVDWDHNLRLCGLDALDVLALVDPTAPQSLRMAPREIRNMSSNDRAMVTKTCIFRVTDKLYHDAQRLQMTKAAGRSIAEKMRAARACMN